jgi:hypothetical protein
MSQDACCQEIWYPSYCRNRKYLAQGRLDRSLLAVLWPTYTFCTSVNNKFGRDRFSASPYFLIYLQFISERIHYATSFQQNYKYLFEIKWNTKSQERKYFVIITRTIPVHKLSNENDILLFDNSNKRLLEKLWFNALHISAHGYIRIVKGS